MGNSSILFEVLHFTEDNLAKALSNEHTSIEYIKKGKYHFNFLFEHLKYQNRPRFKVKTILIEHKYISHTYLSDLGAEFIFSSQDYSKFCKRVHFFSRSFTSVEEIITDPENTSTKRIWDSYRGFVTVKPLPKSRLGPVLLSPYPSSTNADRRFTAIRPYTIHLLGRRIQLDSLAFMEQDGILSACSTVALWSAIHRLHNMFNVGIPRPVSINTLAKYTAHNQPGALPGIGMDLHQICGVIEQIGLKAELRTLNGNLGYNVKLNNKPEVKDKTFVRKFIYAYLKMGLPILLGLEFEDEGKHLITLTGYKAVNTQKATWIKNCDQPIAYADQIQTLYAHDDQVGPFSRVTLLDDGSKVKTIRLKDPTAKVTRHESEVYSIIVPLSKDIRLTFEDIYQQTLHFESLFVDLIDTDQQLIWDIYLTPTNEYRQSVVKKDSHYSPLQKTKLLTEFLPPYLWVARAEVAGYPEMEFIFDATAISYSNDFCIDVLFFDEVLEDLIREALTVPEKYDKERYLLINNVNQFIDSKMDSTYVWSVIKNTLIGKAIVKENESSEMVAKPAQIEEAPHDFKTVSDENQITEDEELFEEELLEETHSKIQISNEESPITDAEEQPKLEKLKAYWVEMITQADIETPLKEYLAYCKQFMESRFDEAVLLQGRYNSLKERDRKGLLTFENYSVERNRIADALFDFVKSL